MPDRERERQFFERFRQCWPSCPGGPYVHGDDKEQPDFLITTPTGIVGVELTELFRPEPENSKKPLQSFEGDENFILNQARLAYERGGGPAVNVSVHFEIELATTKARRLELADWIARWVRESVKAPEEVMSIENEYDDTMPEEIDYVRLAKGPTVTQSLWQNPRAGWEWPAQPASIQARIDSKNERIGTYRQHCDHVWVLIVFSGEAPSQFIDVSLEATNHAYSSVFEKTFLLDSFHRKVHELKTQRG